MTGAGRLGARDLLLLLITALALLAPGIASFPPVDRDEPRYAVATSQMLATHDFIDIRYQAQPRYLQPAGVYWLQALPTAIFSTPEHRSIWTFRLASLFGAVLAVLITAAAASRMLGRPAGMGAAVLLASCLSLGFEARIAKTDAALLAAVVVAQFALMRTYLGPRPPLWVACAFWIALGAGVLLKGPIILLVTALTTVALVLWDRRAAWLLGLRPAWGWLLTLAVALPWYVAIGLKSHGEFYRIAIGRSMMGKVAAGQQAHGAPPGYHLVGFPLTFWPASLFALLAIPFAWARRREPQVRFLIAWTVPSWIVFELIKTKLPHYVLPLFPAIACLAALALFSPKVGAKPLGRVLGWLWVAVWVVLSLGVIVLGPVAQQVYEKRTDALAILLSVGAAAAVAALLWSLWRRRGEWAVGAAALASLFTAANLYAVSLPHMQSLWISPRVEQLVEETRPCPQDVLITTPYHEPSLVFLHGPGRTQLAENPQEAADRLARAGACAAALVGEAQRPAFLARAQADGLAVRPVGETSGRDYADGHAARLTLYAPAPARP